MNPRPQRAVPLQGLDLSWELAVRRLRQDVDNDFWPDPLTFVDVLGPPEEADGKFPDLLRDYEPKQGITYHIPKGNLVTRESIYLGPLDRLLYQALVDRLAPLIDPLLSETVYSYRLASPTGKYMFRRIPVEWRRFREAIGESLRRRPGAFLVVTDVSRYFEGIQFSQLRMQFEKMLGSRTEELRPCLDALFQCLHQWSPHGRFGLVQNVEASSFLGNAFLDGVDKRMAADGFPVFRWMDDIKIVVPNEAAGRKALIQLSGYLRGLGLGLNSAKTRILAADDERITDHIGADDPDVCIINDAFEQGTHVAISGIVELLFAKTESLLRTKGPDAALTRFCLNRSISIRRYRGLELPTGDQITALVLQSLVTAPDETETLCRYVSVSPLSPIRLQELHRLRLTEPLCVYEWQNFHLWRLITQKRHTSLDLTQRAHQLVSGDPSLPEAAGAALYLGSTGDYADLDSIAARLRHVATPLALRCFQIALQRHHKAVRNVATQNSEKDYESSCLNQYLDGLQDPVFVSELPAVEIEDLRNMITSVYG